jgi:hypothetical protein
MSNTSRPLQTIHKQGYLFKEGTFFSTWNERYFSLETSLLKQFTDAENALPTYSIYLGTAAVDGLYSPEDNTENGHGNMWSFVIRWPLPTAPDILEEQWAFMHLGSYDRSEIEEWYDSLVALINVEQTKRLMTAVRSGSSSPTEAFPIPAGRVPTLIIDRESRKIVPTSFQTTFDRFVDDFNSACSLSKWKLISNSNSGFMSQSRRDSLLWKFSVAIPRNKAGPKRIWESLLSPAAASWEPLVKNACAAIEEQDAVIKDDKQLVSDIWTMTSRIGSGLVSLVVGASFERVGFRDDKTGIYVVIGKPTTNSQSGREISFESIAWTVESVSDQSSVLTVFWRLAGIQKDLPLGMLSSFFPQTLAEAIIRPTAVRIRCFIQCQ